MKNWGQCVWRALNVVRAVKIAKGWMRLESGQGPGYAGPQGYTEVFGFLSSGLQRTTAAGVGGDPGGVCIRKR